VREVSTSGKLIAETDRGGVAHTITYDRSPAWQAPPKHNPTMQPPPLTVPVSSPPPSFVATTLANAVQAACAEGSPFA
jgi:hypothetical protein